MKITAKQKIGIPILSLLLAFSILAFQHHENHLESSNTDKSNSSINESASLDQESYVDDRINDSSIN